MSNLLITGGAGFIGSNFVYYWQNKYPTDNIVVLDALTYAGNLNNLSAASKNPNYSFVHGNILDTTLIKELLESHKIDNIVHFAAESHVDRSIHDPDAFIKTNIEGTYSLLKAAKSIWLKGSGQEHRFHHISTDEVYGTLLPHDPAFTETNQYQPNSPYAASKASSDHLVRSYQHTYNLNTSISNCSNNYGPFQFPEKLIPLVIINILNGQQIPIYGDGEQVRDWLYVDDHNRAIDLILKHGQDDSVYNIGGNNEWTNLDIVKLICDTLDHKFELSKELFKQFPDAIQGKGQSAQSLITFVNDRAGHDRRYSINASKIQNELGYLPQESFDTGIIKTIEWYLSNEKWWKAVMDGHYRQWLEKNY